MNRRTFLQLAGVSAVSGLIGLPFETLQAAVTGRDGYDVIVVGAGLGGLSCAAQLAHKGVRPLLLEQHYRLGGYATSFSRHDDQGREFTCEVSLHSSALGAPESKTMLESLGIWKNLSLAPHPHAWSSRFPGFSLDIPARAGLKGFERQLTGLFPDEAAGITQYFTLWRAVMAESEAMGGPTPDFPKRFPHLWAIRDKTVGELVNGAVHNPRLRAVLTQSCGYYGLPPSQLAAFVYLLPTGQYLEYGGVYIKGTSQVLSDALAEAVTDAGGEVRTRTRVAAILVRDGRAVGVRTADGQAITARAVVCNACAPRVFDSLLPAGGPGGAERTKLASLTVSPGSIIVWLGLDRDITRQFSDPEVSFYPSEDMEANYAAEMAGDLEHAHFSMMVYDNLVPGFSPAGCSTICLVCLCGYGLWKRFEADYDAGRKADYVVQKRRLADILIRRAEALALPGLSKMIVMRDASTPLTNRRFTGNAAGAIYGFAPTVNNAFLSRLPNTTEVPGLFLSSAWGSPGGGFTGALQAGSMAFQDVVKALG